MALRNIRTKGDNILRKKCKEVKEIDDNVNILIDDMLETMYKANGVGLAAPQIGILKRIVVIDIGKGPIVLINPKIIGQKGEQTDAEGCLSVPGVSGIVTRPKKVKVQALDRDGNEVVLTGQNLLARAFCHELDHLEGILFIDKVEKYLD